jgi:hypothetical protein
MALLSTERKFTLKKSHLVNLLIEPAAAAALLMHPILMPLHQMSLSETYAGMETVKKSDNFNRHRLHWCRISEYT